MIHNETPEKENYEGYLKSKEMSRAGVLFTLSSLALSPGSRPNRLSLLSESTVEELSAVRTAQTWKVVITVPTHSRHCM